MSGPVQPWGAGRAGHAGLLLLPWAWQLRGDQVQGPLLGCLVGLTTAALREVPRRPRQARVPQPGQGRCQTAAASLQRCYGGSGKTGQLRLSVLCWGPPGAHLQGARQ